jgi:hypothetical protein
MANNRDLLSPSGYEQIIARFLANIAAMRLCPPTYPPITGLP